MKKTINKYIIFSFVICILVFIDQLSKYLVSTRLDDDKNYPVLKHIFSFEYLENRGVAFGILSGKMPLITVLVIIITLIILFAIYIIENAISVCNTKSSIKKFVLLQIICIFLIAGSIGNMIDRIRLGYVVDFIKFDFFDFPTFNIADCYVTIAVFILLVMLLFFISENEFELITFKKINNRK